MGGKVGFYLLPRVSILELHRSDPGIRWRTLSLGPMEEVESLKKKRAAQEELLVTKAVCSITYQISALPNVLSEQQQYEHEPQETSCACLLVLRQLILLDHLMQHFGI